MMSSLERSRNSMKVWWVFKSIEFIVLLFGIACFSYYVLGLIYFVIKLVGIL